MTQTLIRLGWSPHFQDAFDGMDDSSLKPARVSVEHRGRYQLLWEGGSVEAWPPQRMRKKTSSLARPGVGDWVAFRPSVGNDLAHVVAVLDRKTALMRQAAGDRPEPQLVAANLDTVFVVTSMNQEFNPRRLERYLIAIGASGAAAVVVVNKTDLNPSEIDAYREQVALVTNSPVLFTSAVSGEGLDALTDQLGKGRTIALVGSSGVGKSTILNALLGSDAQVTAEVRQTDARGRHTTSHRELFVLPENRGVLVDTPGMRELQLWSADGLNEVFSDVVSLISSCRFSNCRHSGEPGCEVAAALEEGALRPQRWASYLKLSHEIEIQDKRRRQYMDRLDKPKRHRRKRRDR